MDLPLHNEIGISLGELREYDLRDIYLIDVRSSYEFRAGHIDGAVNDPEPRYNSGCDRPVIVYGRTGNDAKEAAEALRANGCDARYLTGGYRGWVVAKLGREAENAAEHTFRAEQSIRKKYHNVLWSKFAKAITTYRLVSPGDRIAVCISGGKDSMLMAKLFQEMKMHDKFPFELVFLVMDPGYSPENRAIIEGNAKILGIPITVFGTDIFGSVFNVKNNPCYLCARMRRGHLYNKAKELGCNKIALGHHFDDVIETNLMSMIYGGQVQTMLPRINSSNFEGMQLIRPMYFIREKHIINWKNYNDLHFLQCACRFTENISETEGSGEHESKRQEIKELIAELAKKNPQIEHNIFRSMENINVNSVISYKQDGIIHNFLDKFED